MKPSKIYCFMILVFSLISGLIRANAEGYQFVHERLYDQDETGTRSPMQHNPQDTGSLAQSFVAPYEFTGVGIGSHTWEGTGAGFRMRLFSWNTDYATSIAGPVLGEADIVNYADNSYPVLHFAFSFPPGNFLLVTDAGIPGTGACGHWGWANSNHYVTPNNAALRNAEYIEGFVFDVVLARSFLRIYETVEDYFTPGASSPISLATNHKIGQRFTATQQIHGVEVLCPTWGANEVKGLTLNLYKWEGSYSATVAEDPLATEVYSALYDNFWNYVGLAEYPNAYLKPGQYFWEMLDPTSTTTNLDVGAWLVNQSAYTSGEAYIDGVTQTSTSLNWIIPFNNSGSWTPTQFLGTYPEASLSQTFEVSTPIYGVGIQSPSWSGNGAGYRMRLYAWNSDFDTTLGEPVLAEKTFENYPDNGWNQIELTSPQPAGQYLLHTDQPVFGTGAAGHRGWKNSSFNTGLDVPNAYIDGHQATDNLETYGYLVFNIEYATGWDVEYGPDFMSRGVIIPYGPVEDWNLY